MIRPFVCTLILILSAYTAADAQDSTLGSDVAYAESFEH